MSIELTELLDLQPLRLTALRNPSYEALYQDFKHFNPIQTQKVPDSIMRVVYIAPLEAIAKERYCDRVKKFGGGLGLQVVELTGETTMDLKLLENVQIINRTPEKWDALSRCWEKRQYVQQGSLFIIDELRLIEGQCGPVLEVIVSGMTYIASQVENKIWIVALLISLLNAKDLRGWIGATSHGLFNFPLEHVKLIAVYLMTDSSVENEESPAFQLRSPEELMPFVGKSSEQTLRETLSYVVGYLHEDLSSLDQEVVSKLFEAGLDPVMSSSLCWGVPLSAHLVVVIEIDNSEKCVILCCAPYEEYYKRFLPEAFPMESHLHHFLCDNFNAEVVVGVIESKQDAVDYLTWTFMYGRLTQNPNCYNLQGCGECKRRRSGRVYHCTVSDYHLHVCAKTVINELQANGVQDVEKPSMLGTATKVASKVVIEFIRGLIEGLGEGVEQVLIQSVTRGRHHVKA
ncbi:hypothetical protein SLEP1_g11249 [Rubroshorea leprosula]|uniref:DNA 3'-5' helicase n=1 Tax=Rubroshorea leprosula TaxID=152421 RepID=A0AAV5IJY9_9ROSI|nr:hypothetical protein SLEP1_g11249 [Rubroshorea leprosula]